MRKMLAKILQKNVKGFVTVTDKAGNQLGGWVHGDNWFIQFGK
jgi:hypothetical protein